MDFAHEYKFDMEDCYKKDSMAPKFCFYNNLKQVYMTRDIMDGLADTTEKKKILLDYVKDHFSKPGDYEIILEEDYEKNNAVMNTDIFHTNFLRKMAERLSV